MQWYNFIGGFHSKHRDDLDRVTEYPSDILTLFGQTMLGVLFLFSVRQWEMPFNRIHCCSRNFRILKFILGIWEKKTESHFVVAFCCQFWDKLWFQNNFTMIAMILYLLQCGLERMLSQRRFWVELLDKLMIEKMEGDEQKSVKIKMNKDFSGMEVPLQRDKVVKIWNEKPHR